MATGFNINILSLRLVVLMMALMLVVGVGVLGFALPFYYQHELRYTMQKLVDSARLESAVEPSHALAVVSHDGAMRWFGRTNTIAQAQMIEAQAWCDTGFHHFTEALRLLFAATPPLQVISIDANHLPMLGITGVEGDSIVVFPSDGLAADLYRFVLLGVVMLMIVMIAVGVPSALLLEKLVVAPMRAMIVDMAEFTKDPYQPRPDISMEGRSGIVAEARIALAAMANTARLELVQRDKLAATGEAVAKINHDMRNVLASAVLISDNLLTSSDPAVQKSAPMVVQSVGRAVALCGQILAFLKTPRAITPEPTDMAALIGECGDTVGITTAYQGPQFLLVDGGSFFRLIHNLISNAAAAGASRVDITVWRAGDLAVMDIADNGPGIDKVTQAVLFKPFMGSAKGGSGLGLSIARDSALGHGGDLRLARSNHLGSEFRVRLPVTVLGNVGGKNRRRWW